jgi:glycosyltransferase involved in cell wall biosynthesis
MSLKLLSHVNADADLIESWLKYYLRLGVERFHLIVHGTAEENARLFAIKDSYPIIIEDMYPGPFESEQKKNRLDAFLSRNTNQWVVLVDSDEFVEFPYDDIPETIRILNDANANLMAAPMLQRLKADGSLDTPSIIDDPFQIFPLCSTALYWRVGIKAEIFKFPLFYCGKDTRVMEEGNHNPPLGCEPRASGILGVTHHFKFRSAISQRLQKRIDSAHAFRQESVQLREYLNSHSDRLPLAGSFLYSREDLFRRGLLKRLPEPRDYAVLKEQLTESCAEQPIESEAQPATTSVSKPSPHQHEFLDKRIILILPKAEESSDLERYVVELVRGLCRSRLRPVIVCLERDTISTYLNREELALITVQCESEPKSFFGWLRMIRKADPEVIVFCYRWIEAFSWQPVVAALLAGVQKRFSIQYLMPIRVSPPERRISPSNLMRRMVGKRARRLLKIKISGLTATATICVNSATRNALVNWYRFPERNTITIPQGISASFFRPCRATAKALRAQMGIGPDDFTLVCVANLAEDNGIEILIHAVSRVLRQGIECKCIIVGDGPLREQLTQKTNSLGLSNWIFFEGFQSDARLYLQAGSVFILTSFSEGMQRSVLEAMACGLPCIVTNVGGTAEAVKDKDVGLLIPPGSVEATEHAVEYLATHPEECAEMARKARQLVCRDFNLDKRLDELRSVIVD